MSESDDLDAIREAKKEALKERLSDDDTAGTNTTDSAAGTTAPTEPIHIDDADHLDDVLSTHPVVLVDFYADWCGPCQMLEPVVEALHADGTAVVAKVDVDHHQGIAQRHNVRGVPTMLLAVDGEPVDRHVGATDKASLESIVARHT